MLALWWITCARSFGSYNAVERYAQSEENASFVVDMHWKRWKHRLDCNLKTEKCSSIWNDRYWLRWITFFSDKKLTSVCLLVQSTWNWLHPYQQRNSWRPSKNSLHIEEDLVYNGNGKNFVGVKNLLQKINWSKISQYCLQWDNMAF